MELLVLNFLSYYVKLTLTSFPLNLEMTTRGFSKYLSVLICMGFSKKIRKPRMVPWGTPHLSRTAGLLKRWTVPLNLESSCSTETHFCYTGVNSVKVHLLFSPQDQGPCPRTPMVYGSGSSVLINRNIQLSQYLQTIICDSDPGLGCAQTLTGVHKSQLFNHQSTTQRLSLAPAVSELLLIWVQQMNIEHQETLRGTFSGFRFPGSALILVPTGLGAFR